MLRIRASVLCLDKDKLLTVRLRDPFLQISRLFPPGGQIEEGEEPAHAAIREAKEETGYELSVGDRPAAVLDYDFFWDGRHVPCRSYFYLASLKPLSPAPVHDASYHEGVFWLPTEQAAQSFAYHERLWWTYQKILNLP